MVHVRHMRINKKETSTRGIHPSCKKERKKERKRIVHGNGEYIAVNKEKAKCSKSKDERRGRNRAVNKKEEEKRLLCTP